MNTDTNYNINIEKAVLSSILFDNSQIEIAKSLINVNDFYMPKHQKIYEIMIHLEEKSMPIDEEFIGKIIKNGNTNVTEDDIIDVLSANPITNFAAYLGEIKESAVKRRLINLTSQIKQLVSDENNTTAKIFSEIEDKLSFLSKEGSEDFLKAKPLSDIEEEDTKYICKKFVPFPEFSVGLISARGGMGKTFAALKICDEYVAEKLEETGEYKNTLILATEDRAGKLKARANKLGLKHQKNIKISSIYSFDVLEKDYRTQNWKLTEDFYKFKTNSANYDLIIIDPMISFYSGKENDNGDAKAFMKPFVRLADERNQNIIFLHHADKGGTGSRGAGAFADATRLTYFVTKESFKNEDGKFEEVKNTRKLRFEIQKQNDDISSIKKLEDITIVANIGSFLATVFPIKVDVTSSDDSKSIKQAYEGGSFTKKNMDEMKFFND